MFDPALPYELHPDVVVRPEPFGALAYHYGSRRLTFLRSSELVGLVGQLAEGESVNASLAALATTPQRRGALLGALAALERSQVIRPRGSVDGGTS